MKYLLVCCLGLIFISACGVTYDTPRAKESYRIMNAFTSQMYKEKGFRVLGIGSAMPDCVRQLIIHFTSNQKVDISQARILLIDLIDKFLAKVNEDMEIQQYLLNYPFNENNLEMSITFCENGDSIPPPHIAIVMILDGRICYSINTDNQYETVFRETYQEAINIVRSQLVKEK